MNIVEILPNDILYRRVLHPTPPNMSCVKPDGTICSPSFNLRIIEGKIEDGISVDLERLTDYYKTVKDTNRNIIITLNVNSVLSIELDINVEHNPIIGNHAHTLIINPSNHRKFGKFLSKIAEHHPYNKLYHTFD